MDISSQITVAVKPELYKSKSQMGALEPGRTLKLKIIELNGNRALIDFGNFRATADIKIPVTLGEELMVRVLEAGQQLKLGVITVDQKNPMSPEISGQPHFMEEKETLSKIFGPRTLAILKGVVDTLLSDINQQQGRAVSQRDSADPFQVFTYALPLKEGDPPARLKVFYEKKQKPGSKKGFQISLLLSMDRLGDVRTDFYLLENNLNLTFYVTKPAASIEIHENYQELHDLLDDLFDQVQLTVKVSEKRVINFDRPDIQKAGSQRVDLRI